MRFCIETIDGAVFEVTNLFDRHGCDTDHLEIAETCVIKFGKDEWGEALIEHRTIHRVH